MEQARLVDGIIVVVGANDEESDVDGVETTCVGESEVGDMETANVEELGVDNKEVTVEIGESSVLEIGESSGLQTGESSASPHPAAAPPELPP